MGVQMHYSERNGRVPGTLPFQIATSYHTAYFQVGSFAAGWHFRHLTIYRYFKSGLAFV